MSDDPGVPATPRGVDREPAPDLDRFVADFGTAFAAATQVAPDAAARTGVGPGGPARARRTRRPIAMGRARIAVVGATTLAAVVAGVVLLPLAPAPKPFAKNFDPVAEARAALGGGGEIVHYVTRTEHELRGFTPTEPSLCKPTQQEVWQATTHGPRWRAVHPGMDRTCGIMSRGDLELRGEQQLARTATESVEYYPELGKVFVTTDLPSTGPSSYGGLPVIDAPDKYQGADVVSTLRHMLRDGYLRNAGLVTYRGRSAWQLVGVTRTTTGKGRRKVTTESRLKYLVAVDTFTPMELKTSRNDAFFSQQDGADDGKTESVYTTTFLTYETLPATPENERLLAIQPVGPVTTETSSAAQQAAEEAARMKQQNAEGRANAKRINAEREARERRSAATKQP